MWTGQCRAFDFLSKPSSSMVCKQAMYCAMRRTCAHSLMDKILNDLSAPQPSNSFVKLNDTLGNIETDLALPRSCTNFLKRSFKYSSAMLWNDLSYEAKTLQSLSDFKHKLASSPSMLCTGSHWFHVIYFFILSAFIYTYAPPGNHLLLCVASAVKLSCVVLYCTDRSNERLHPLSMLIYFFGRAKQNESKQLHSILTSQVVECRVTTEN